MPQPWVYIATRIAGAFGIASGSSVLGAVISNDPAVPDDGWRWSAFILILVGVVLELAPLIHGKWQSGDE